MDCNFDQGACEWVQDKADDMDWIVAYRDSGNEVAICGENSFPVQIQLLTEASNSPRC